jgi:NTP pyrophosphohydrolases including oxidative damage repair enzymes
MVTRAHDKIIQGVDIIAEIQGNFIVNIEKRYPVDSFVISFPGGISESSDIIEEGLRELKEETGYTGDRENSTTGPLTYADP